MHSSPLARPAPVFSAFLSTPSIFTARFPIRTAAVQANFECRSEPFLHTSSALLLSWGSLSRFRIALACTGWNFHHPVINYLIIAAIILDLVATILLRIETKLHSFWHYYCYYTATITISCGLCYLLHHYCRLWLFIAIIIIAAASTSTVAIEDNSCYQYYSIINIIRKFLFFAFFRARARADSAPTLFCIHHFSACTR